MMKLKAMVYLIRLAGEDFDFHPQKMKNHHQNKSRIYPENEKHNSEMTVNQSSHTLEGLDGMEGIVGKGTREVEGFGNNGSVTLLFKLEFG